MHDANIRTYVQFRYTYYYYVALSVSLEREREIVVVKETGAMRIREKKTAKTPLIKACLSDQDLTSRAFTARGSADFNVPATLLSLSK